MKKIALTILTALCLIIPNVAQADITTGLIHYWTFDDGSGTTAIDTGSSPSNGTLITNGSGTLYRVMSDSCRFIGVPVSTLNSIWT